MKTRDLAKLQALRSAPIVVTGAIAGTVGAAKVYYVKLPVGARLARVTALMDATTDVARAITISKATVAAATSKFRDASVVAGSGLTTAPVDVADTALLTGTTTTGASSIVFTPSTDFSAAKLALPTTECVKISVADPTTGKAISGQIILEFLPV